MLLAACLTSFVQASPPLTRSEVDAHIDTTSDGQVKLCPIGRCRYYADTEEDLLKHALEYHGVNSTQFEEKAGQYK